MKTKLLVAAASLFGSMVLFACRSNVHNCTCTYNDGSSQQTTSTSLTGLTRPEASTSCKMLETSFQNSGYTNVNCALD